MLPQWTMPIEDVADPRTIDLLMLNDGLQRRKQYRTLFSNRVMFLTLGHQRTPTVVEARAVISVV